MSPEFQIIMGQLSQLPFPWRNLNPSKYSRWYDALMERARSRGKLPKGERELHHPWPRSLGGRYLGVVHLTFREHFLAHMLLPRFCVGSARVKMLYALGAMTMQREVFASWQYEISARAKRAAIGVWWKDAENRKLMRPIQSAKVRKLWDDLEHRERMSTKHRKMWSDPDVYERRVRHLLEPELRAQTSIRTREKWRDPEYRALMSAAISASHRGPKRVQLYQSPEFLAWGRAKMLKHWQDPKFRAHVSARVGAASRDRWQDPKFRAHMSAKLRAAAARRRYPLAFADLSIPALLKRARARLNTHNSK